MSQKHSTDSEELFTASLVYNDEPEDEPGFEYEIFIVSVGSAV